MLVVIFGVARLNLNFVPVYCNVVHCWAFFVFLVLCAARSHEYICCLPTSLYFDFVALCGGLCLYRLSYSIHTLDTTIFFDRVLGI